MSRTRESLSKGGLLVIRFPANGRRVDQRAEPTDPAHPPKVKGTSPVYVCADQNALRSNELARLVAETEVGFLLPDAALMEMCKSEQWESTLRRSLRSLATVPERVHLTLGNGELMSQEQALQRPLYCEELMGSEPTKFLRQLLREVNENAPSGPSIDQLRLHWAERRQAMAKGHLNHDENAAAIRMLIPTIRNNVSEETLRRFRAGKLNDQERISVVSGITSAIFPSAMHDGGIGAEAADHLFKAKSYLARYLWLRVYAVVKWIELGGSETVNPKKATNNLVDSHYVLVGSYFDRLLTSDGYAASADQALRAALAPEFDWDIDVNYLTA